MDVEGARALARRIAAQEQATKSAAASGADGQTLEERLADGRASPADVEQRRVEASISPGVELRIYAREVEEQLVDGKSTYVEIWWCRVRKRGVWQAPVVVREVVREAVPPAQDPGFFRLVWRLVDSI